jgi:hypothetical protein
MKYLKVICVVLLFFAGAAIGYFVKHFPIIEFNKELKIYEVFNLLLTATIGLFIPFFIKRWIEDSRQVKNNLIEELKDTLKETERIKDKIKFCYSRNSISQTDKDEINYLFEQSDFKFNCLDELFISTFEVETKILRADLKDIYFSYWKCVTGGELMTSKFNVISEDFVHRHNDSFSKFEIKIKQTINKVHRL